MGVRTPLLQEGANTIHHLRDNNKVGAGVRFQQCACWCELVKSCAG